MISQKTITILGVVINTERKKDILLNIQNILHQSKNSYIVTPNPEICLKAMDSHEYKEALNGANIHIPDGSGLAWAASFINSTGGINNSKYLNIFIFFLLGIISIFQFIFSKKYRHKIIPEIIHGSDLMVDIISYCEKNNFSIFLLGGKNGTAKKAANKLTEMFPKLRVAGTYEGSPDLDYDKDTLYAINTAKPDVVFVAFGAPNQELWIKRNINKTNIRLAMGVGGAFDFISGNVERAPKSYQKNNVEWLWRLKKEPWRKGRIFNAVIHFPYMVFVSKIYSLRPYRPNVACVIIDSQKRFLILNNSYIYSRSEDHSHWQLLQGGKRPYEGIKTAALRESKEEMGSSNLHYIDTADQTYTYEWPIRSLRITRPFKGQKQTIVFLKYTGDYTDIRINPKEHSEFTWVTREELISKLHPIRSKMANIVLRELTKKNILEKI